MKARGIMTAAAPAPRRLLGPRLAAHVTLAAVAALAWLAPQSPVQACWFPQGVQPPAAAGGSGSSSGAAADCSTEERQWQVGRFFKRRIGAKGGTSSCAPHWWLLALAEPRPPLAAPPRVVIADVGCNKGYFSGVALNAFAPGASPNHIAALYASHEARHVYPMPCGGCGECMEQPPPASRRRPGARLPAEVDVHCFEPSLVHLKSLQLATAAYGSSGSSGGAKGVRVRWQLVHGAVANYSGAVTFATGCATNECSLGDRARGHGASRINVTTVDAYLAQHGIEALDVLKIDAEGFDPAVIAGAYRSLAAQRVRSLVFEYHELWARSGGTLRQCVAYLGALGYTCYYDTARGLGVRLSGACWHDKLAAPKWANIVCAPSGRALDGELMASSMLAAYRRSGGRSGSAIGGGAGA